MFSEVLEFALELNLCNRRRCLCCEGKAEAGLTAFLDDLIDDTGFACSCWRRYENWVEFIDKSFNDGGVAKGFLGWDKDI